MFSLDELQNKCPFMTTMGLEIQIWELHKTWRYDTIIVNHMAPTSAW